MDIQSSFLPSAVKAILLESNLDIDNFSLKLNKACYFDGDEEKFVLLKSVKGELVYQIRHEFDAFDFKSLDQRNTAIVNALGYEENNNSLLVFNAKANWRWVIGLGNASVYENGITLHHVYGIPFLPGSALKGLLRNWIIFRCFGRNNEAEARALGNTLFKAVFGHPSEGEFEGKQGKAVFFDAFPMEPPQIAPDVMNAHFQPYYEKKKPPADWLSPNPVFFMTIKGGKYKFKIGLKPGDNLALSDFGSDGKALSWIFEDKASIQECRILDLLGYWLEDSLEFSGIGAKTAVGYGRMKKN